MEIKLLFFGVLTDAAKTNEVKVEGLKSLDEVKNYVFQNYPEVMNFSHIIAVNRDITKENISLSDGDEVAFLPPFTGG